MWTAGLGSRFFVVWGGSQLCPREPKRPSPKAEWKSWSASRRKRPFQQCKSVGRELTAPERAEKAVSEGGAEELEREPSEKAVSAEVAFTMV
ncbi:MULTISPECIES: hypothetical protein [Paenibacillus]|uniref:Uncharacterized protein n=1 Tax=Paenibacillus violae TaxID=3077234 RepID=A0ABU3RGJ3_9BACL|nr:MULTISPECIES: hypothetical protein [Paenibacillus]MDU0203413.1 hypothetical protein [Paenibacillus sp. PFR10]MEC0266954.1 hypothetical protein [Paenibacillus anseongense]